MTQKAQAQRLQQELSCFEINYQHNPFYRMGKYDGKKKFYTVKISTEPKGWFFYTQKGFVNRIQDIFDIEIQTPDNDLPSGMDFLKEELLGIPFKPYKHQLRLFLGLIENDSHLGVSSVGCLHPSSKVNVNIDDGSIILLDDFRKRRKNKTKSEIEVDYNNMKKSIKNLYNDKINLSLNDIFLLYIEYTPKLVRRFLNRFIKIRKMLDVKDNLTPERIIHLFKYKFLNENTSKNMVLEKFVSIGLNKQHHKQYHKNEYINSSKSYGTSEFGKKGADAVKIDKQTNPEKYKNIQQNQIGYWLNQGFTKEESKKLVSQRQSTFSLELCIERYGIIEGVNVFNERQNKWQQTLENKPELETLEINKRKNPILNKTQDEILEYSEKCKIRMNTTYMKLKIRKTKEKTGSNVPINEIPDFIVYKRLVWYNTKQNDLKELDNFNLRGNKSDDYQLDHKYSIFQGFVDNILPYHIGKLTNLIFIPAIENRSKGKKCSISFDEVCS